MYNFNEDTLFANKYIHKRRSYTCVTVSNKRPLHCLRIRPTSSLCSAHIAVTAVSNMRHSLFTRRGQIDKVRHLQTRFFSKLTICFFVTFNRKPYAESRLVTSPMTSDDPERSKMQNRKWFDLSRSPEVNKFCTVRKAVYDFLLVNNSNFVAISHRLRDMSGQIPKIHSPPGGVRGVSTFPKSRQL